MIDPDHEAFSTAPHDDDEYALISGPHHRDDMHHEELDGGSAYDPTISSYGGGTTLGSNTEYAGATAGAGRGAGRVVYVPPVVSDVGAGYRRYGEEDLEHGGYDGGESGRVRFPAANY